MPPLIKIPSPGAVCPAMVKLPLSTYMFELRLIVPPTSKTIVLVPEASKAALKLPLPELLRFVTLITCPPLPPLAYFPKPSAEGNANCCEKE